MKDPARLATIQKNLEKSVALDPEFADAYALLGLTYMTDANYGAAVTATQKAVALSPRNEDYAFNLAQMYLAERKTEPAIGILKQLTKSSNPEIAARAGQSLTQAEEYQQALANMASENPVAPGRSGDEVVVSSHPAVVEPEPVSPGPSMPMRFVKGKVTAVDCSSPPAALLTVVAGAQTLKLQVKDSSHVIVIGADSFSCAWKNQSIAVNFRPTGATGGDVVSVEVH